MNLSLSFRHFFMRCVLSFPGLFTSKTACSLSTNDDGHSPPNCTVVVVVVVVVVVGGLVTVVGGHVAITVVGVQVGRTVVVGFA